MPRKFPPLCCIWIILGSSFAYAANAAKIGIFASTEDNSNDTMSWVLLNSSAASNDEPIESFTICLRFRIRMFPNGAAFVSVGEGENMDADNKTLRFYLGYSPTSHGLRRSGFHIRFVNSTNALWAPMMDSKRSPERALDLFLPNLMSHLCLSYSSVTRIIRFVLVGKVMAHGELKHTLMYLFSLFQDGIQLDDKIVPPNFKQVKMAPNFLSQFKIQSKKGFMFSDLNIWNYTLATTDMINWSTCK